MWPECSSEEFDSDLGPSGPFPFVCMYGCLMVKHWLARSAEHARQNWLEPA